MKKSAWLLVGALVVSTSFAYAQKGSSESGCIASIQKLHLVSLRNTENALTITRDLINRGYDAYVLPEKDFMSVVVQVQTDKVSELKKVAGELKRITGSEPKLILK
ncbi:SPOR domain-containing protein [Vibrio breoganii]|uniref:SPOR domain-containing protein n=1 Tax=Vibrio breoganii TaxID=553239 RepID=UPI00031A050D|nr:hypothetical protein [Vibrio breoganii]OED98149.1 hypothetical protein A1QG_11410 [Vibrio breoganii ZF-29]